MFLQGPWGGQRTRRSCNPDDVSLDSALVLPEPQRVSCDNVHAARGTRPAGFGGSARRVTHTARAGMEQSVRPAYSLPTPYLFNQLLNVW